MNQLQNSAKENIENLKRFSQDIRTPLYILNIAAALITIILVLFIYLPNFSEYAISAVLATTIFFTSLASLIFTHRGQPSIAASLLVSTIFMVAIAIGVTFTGLQNPSVMALLVLIIPISSLYFDRQQTIIVIGIVMLGVIGLQIGGGVGSLSLEPLDTDDFIITLLALGLITAIMQFTTNRLQSLLKSSQENETSLELANQELNEIKLNLENRIDERTQGLTIRNKYLEAITQIAHEANTIKDEQQLLQSVVDLISQKLEYYQVGIFLVDENQEWAELKAASSVGGKRMIDRGHRLRVGRQGIIGFVTDIGQPRISQSTQMDRIHAVVPELPDTRAEMALPLKASGEIIGALDIQDTRENAFTSESVQVMQTLADQVALAIENLRLFGQAEQSLLEAQRAYGVYSRQAWLEAQRAGAFPAYRFSKSLRTGAQKMDTSSLPPLPEDRKIELKIQVRGQTIGVLDILKSDSETGWSFEEKELLSSLSEQLGIALDSARLFNETQKRAATERMVTDLSDQIRGTLDIDTIMKTAVEQIRNALDLPQVAIRLAGQTQDSNGHQQDLPEGE